MARRYSVNTENVNCSAAQDLMQIKGAAGKMLRIIRVAVACVDSTPPTASMLSLRCRFLPATVTDGSGGSTPTPQKLDPGDAAASFTALANNTAKATTSGTAITIREDSTHVFNGYDYPFPRPPVVGPSESLVFELLSTVTGTVHLSGGALVEEIGG